MRGIKPTHVHEDIVPR